MDHSSLEKLCRDIGAQYSLNEPLAPYTSMKIGGACDILVHAGSEYVVREVVSLCKKENIPYFVLGKGSNVLVSDNGYHGCVILVGKDMSDINVDIERNTISAATGASLKSVCMAALENGLTGLEFAYGIPGSVGGALYMNAGAYGGEMKDIVKSCRYVDENGEYQEMNVDEMELSYRHSFFTGKKCIIISVTMELKKGDKSEIKARMDELMQRRRDKQPLEYPSCGSTFKRPEGYFAAALIEECGLKGFTIGGAQVSEKHSGFVINRGGASFEDVMALVDHIKSVVCEKKGVELECEMLILE
ncbi:MAG: UDP-N-acetylmuramate dehydrogenase [Oscillospiraceae bacterium]|nr:UDP-N-acetylmuramate dehydrogenase [Oscillospiraceae bacterium]